MSERKNNVLYVAAAYIVFWAMLVIVGTLILTGIMPDEGVPMMIITSLCSWAPTIALLISFRKLFPGVQIKDFYRSAFSLTLNLKLISFVTALQFAVFIVAAGTLSWIKEIPIGLMFDLSLHSLLTGAGWTIVQGATGEESGWRGYLQPSIEKRSGVIRVAVITGIIWGFWHTPLWFIDTAYTGMTLALYILLFMIAIISVSVIIGICYSRCRNLLIPVWVHFLFNFTVKLFNVDSMQNAGAGTIDILAAYAPLYAVAAVLYAIWHISESRNNNSITKTL